MATKKIVKCDKWSKKLLEKIGFERKNIKTKSYWKSFDINIEYDSIEIKMINGLKNLKAIALFIKWK